MLSFARACFTSAAILLRQRMGGDVAGFVALLNMLSGLLLFAFVMLGARGLLIATGVGRFLDVPIVLPIVGLAVILGVLWTLRTTAIVQTQGPLRDDDRRDDFTGHAAAFWPRLTAIRREWTVLERLEPTVLVVLGLLLVLPPFTRAIGVFFVLAGTAVAIQTTRDRRANELAQDQGADYNGLARLLADTPVEEDLSLASQFQELPAELAVLLDEESQERLAALQQESKQAPVVSDAGGLAVETDLDPRGPLSVTSNGAPTIFAVTALTLIVLNFVFGDVANLYRWSPARWTAAVDSVQRGVAAVGILEHSSSDSGNDRGSLTREFLKSVDPEALKRWEADQLRNAVALADTALSKAEAAYEQQASLARETLGIPLSPSVSSPLFDRLLLTREDAAELWAAVLSVATRLDERIQRARRTVTRAQTSEEAEIEKIKQIRDSAAEWKQAADDLAPHINRLAEMLNTLRAERALEGDRDGGP